MLNLPSHSKKIFKSLAGLSLLPFLLEMVLLFPNSNGKTLKNGISALLDFSVDLGLYGYILQLMLNIWLFTIPLWLITALYCLTQKYGYGYSILIWTIIGSLGQLMVLLTIY